ncbi:MAG TPA: hypothetical protein VGR87_00125 [Candidatus Limnocylindria bacterium]|nr:hypothetical protein [Candidatus Limnocylindria bacterium]
MPSHALLRAALLLTATGIVSASSVRHALDEEATDVALAVGYAFYLGLILLAVPRRPPRWAPLFGFALVAVTYAVAIVTLQGNLIAIAIYIAAAYLGYVTTPPTFRPLTVAAFALWTPALRFFGPEPTEGRFPPILALASVLALFNLVGALLDRTARDPEEHLRRIGLGLLAVATVATVVERHLVVASFAIAPDDLMALVVVGTLPLLAVLRVRPPTRDALATGLALAAFTLTAIALLVGKAYHVDSVTVPHHAAELLLAGQNPYRTFDLPTALAEFGLDPQLVTHYEDGSVLRSLNYPAMSFLVVAPFVAIGVTDVRWIYFAEIVLLVLILLRHVRIPWRPLVAAAAIGNTIIVRQNILAGVDPTWVLLVAVAWLSVGSRWFSPIAVGLAVASRQPAWFVAPFYLIAIWKRDGRAEALRRAGVVAASALVPNLPFIINAPLEFADGISAPMLGALAPYGVGFVRLGIDGALPLLPRGVYGALSGAALLVLALVLWRFWRRMPVAAAVFPFVPLYLAWRSLQNYFGSIPLLAMAADDELLAGEAAVAAEPRALGERAATPAPAAGAAWPARPDNAASADRPRPAGDPRLP